MTDAERMYRDMAWAWPIISPPEDYAEEAEMFRCAIEKHSKIPVRTLLDLGCGGGHNDFHLKKHCKVTGIDLSEGMLGNARALNPDVEYLAGDMRRVRLGRQFDSVIIADSIMYMRDESDMLAAFRTAYEHLRPGGVFCTYIEELPECFAAATYTHQPREKDGVEITLIEHKWDTDAADTTFELLFIYLVKEGRAMRVETDRHRCGIFPLTIWKALLKGAGFTVRVKRLNEPGIKHLLVCAKPTV